MPIEHAGARFETFHMPGHTMFALGLAGTMDGVRVAYTGDNLLAGALSPLRAAAPIYRNVMRLDSIRVGVERLMAYEPELLLTGHTGALEVTRADLDDFVAWARELELRLRPPGAVPGLEDEALDPVRRAVRPVPRDGRRGRACRHGSSSEPRGRGARRRGVRVLRRRWLARRARSEATALVARRRRRPSTLPFTPAASRRRAAPGRAVVDRRPGPRRSSRAASSPRRLLEVLAA